jgi:hypothetical protein
LSPPSWAIPARILTQTQTNVNMVERDGRSFTGTALTYGVSMPAGRISFVKLPGLPNAVQPASEYCYLALCALTVGVDDARFVRAGVVNARRLPPCGEAVGRAPAPTHVPTRISHHIEHTHAQLPWRGASHGEACNAVRALEIPFCHRTSIEERLNSHTFDAP